MNREIKFRVWDEDFKKMVLCNDARFVDGRLIGMKGVNWDSKVVPMQFTGLLDKNGKEIYDKDLLKISFTTNPDNKWKEDFEGIYRVDIGLFETTMYLVKLIKPEMTVSHIHLGAEDYWYDENKFEIDSEYSSGERTRGHGDVEVIGNIYSNPDLVKSN